MSRECVRTGSQPAVTTAAAGQQLCVCLLDGVVAVVQLLLPVLSDKLDLRHISSEISGQCKRSHPTQSKHQTKSSDNFRVSCFCADSTHSVSSLQQLRFKSYLKTCETAVYCVLNCQTDYQPVHTATSETHPMI